MSKHFEKERIIMKKLLTAVTVALAAALLLASCGKKETKTVTVAANHAAVVTKADGSKYVPAGAVIPANGATAQGILYEDVDVSTGNMPGSIVTRGVIYADRLPAALSNDAKSALTGIKVIATAPAVTRPDWATTT